MLAISSYALITLFCSVFALNVCCVVCCVQTELSKQNCVQ